MDVIPKLQPFTNINIWIYILSTSNYQRQPKLMNIITVYYNVLNGKTVYVIVISTVY